MRKRFLNIYSQIEWTYDFLSDDSDDFSFGLFFILRMIFFYVAYLRMVFSISDSQILFTKGQFPCLYYMPASLPPSCWHVFIIIAVTSSMHRDSSLRSE
jgi:hypothetical protein